MSSETPKHAWFSKEQFDVICQPSMCPKPWIYYKMQNGKTVQVTCVSKDKKHGCKFEDMKYLGLVTEFVRSYEHEQAFT